MLTITNMTVNVGGASPLAAALVRAAMEAAPVAGESDTAAPPKIGEIWEGQGGIYAGIYRVPGAGQRHLILAVEAPAAKMEWQTGLDWAKKVTADGHTDFDLPSRIEGALLYANLADTLEHLSDWHWLKEQYSQDNAWAQDFNYGYQGGFDKDGSFRCRAVRSFPA